MLSEWQSDPATSANVTVLLVAGLIYTNEENYVEALRAVHGGHNLEMCAHGATSMWSAYILPVLAGCFSCEWFASRCAAHACFWNMQQILIYIRAQNMSLATVSGYLLIHLTNGDPG